MRRRNHLRVDTFPFLAVLLCAMGSLILVLLVMDRRSRMAARARGADQVRRMIGEHQDKVAARQREQAERIEEIKTAWNRKRSEIRARIDAEQRALDVDLRKLQSRLAEVVHDLRQEEDAVEKLRTHVKNEQTRLAGHEKALLDAQKESAKLKGKLTLGDRARNKLAADIVQMEHVLRELRGAREQEKSAYSIVPYSGVQGQKRDPLYVECTSQGVIFHPEKSTLVEPTNGALRETIEKRLEALAQKRKKSTTPEAKPYVMVLVRPEGIKRYYQLQSALYEMPVEFGYEFIDSEWALSYPTEEEAKLATAGEPARPLDPQKSQSLKPVLPTQDPPHPETNPTPTKDMTPVVPNINMSNPTLNSAGSPGGASLVGTPAQLSKDTATGGSPGVAETGPQLGQPTVSQELPLLRLSPQEATASPKPTPSPSHQQPGFSIPKTLPGSAADVAVNTAPSAIQLGSSSNPQNQPTASDLTSRPRVGNDLGAPDTKPISEARRPQPLLPARIGSASDVVVYIECLSDGVVAHPGGRSFSIESLNHTTGHNPLYQTVQTLLSRSNSSGQKHIRFLIHPDAERTFHLAYPVFNNVTVTKSRYNLLREDDVPRIVAGD